MRGSNQVLNYETTPNTPKEAHWMKKPCKPSRDAARVHSPIGLETNKLWLGEGGWGVYVEGVGGVINLINYSEADTLY